MKTASGGWARSDQEKVDLFADQFANSFTPHDIITDITPDISSDLDERIRFFSPQEVARELDQLSPKKVSGTDEVSVNML